eukprot:795454-Rhodomonas_salina.3
MLDAQEPRDVADAEWVVACVGGERAGGVGGPLVGGRDERGACGGASLRRGALRRHHLGPCPSRPLRPRSTLATQDRGSCALTGGWRAGAEGGGGAADTRDAGAGARAGGGERGRELGEEAQGDLRRGHHLPRRRRSQRHPPPAPARRALAPHTRAGIHPLPWRGYEQHGTDST